MGSLSQPRVETSEREEAQNGSRGLVVTSGHLHYRQFIIEYFDAEGLALQMAIVWDLPQADRSDK